MDGIQLRFEGIERIITGFRGRNGLFKLLLNGFVRQILLHKRVNLFGNGGFQLGLDVVAVHHLFDGRVDLLRLFVRYLTGFDRLAVILCRHAQAALRKHTFQHLRLDRLRNSLSNRLFLLHHFGLHLCARRFLGGFKQRFGVELSQRRIQNVGVVFARQFRQRDSGHIQSGRRELLIGCREHGAEKLCRALIQRVVVGDKRCQTRFQFRCAVIEALGAVAQGFGTVIKRRNAIIQREQRGKTIVQRSLALR